MRSLFFIVFFIVAFHTTATAQDIVFRGDFKEISFPEFVREVEQQTGARFFYLEEWMTPITITASGSGLSLTDILTNQLPAGILNFYIDPHKNIFITKGEKLITELPDYGIDTTMAMHGQPFNDGLQLPPGRDFLEGRMTGKAENIVIGREDQGKLHALTVITGKIMDGESGESLIGASIYIEELKTGAITDVNGHFSLILAPGKYNAVINCLGMKEKKYFLQVYSSGTLNVEMEKRIIPIREVVVEADQFHHVRGIQMGSERLNVKAIKEIPVVLGEKDLLKVAQMLPGIQSVGEGSSGINVRGSPADQNIFYINKVPVYNPNHLFGFFSAFSPDIVKDFSFYKSNLPAKYGGRLASVFEISTTQGNKKEFSARGGISPVTGHLAVEGPLGEGRTSYVLSTRATYSDWLLSELKDPDLRNSNALFRDFTLNISMEPDGKNLFRGFAYSSYDRFRLAASNEYQYANLGGSLGWHRRLSNVLFSDFTAVASSYTFTTADQSFMPLAYHHDYRLTHFELRSDFTWLPDLNHNVTYGGNAIMYDLNRGSVSPLGSKSVRVPVKLGKELGIEGGLYISDEVRIFPRITLYAGLRYSYYAYLGPAKVYLYHAGMPKDKMSIADSLNFSPGRIIRFYSGFEPRLAVNFSSGENSSVKLSYNRIRQYLYMLTNTIAISPTDQWKLCDYHIKPLYSDQFSVGYYKDLPKGGINTSLELYYKKIHHIVDFKDGAAFLSSPQIETEVLQGSQSAWGLEMMIRKNAGKLNGWISYAWSGSEVLVNGKQPWEKINSGFSYPASYDKPHALNLVTNYRFNRRFSFSSNVVYSTGRPVTYPRSIYFINEQPVINYSLRNEYRIPDYFRVDFSLNIEGNLKARKLAHSFWMINVYNLTGRKNAYSVFFKSEEGKINGYKMSVFGVPVVTISWNFKLGNYASD